MLLAVYKAPNGRVFKKEVKTIQQAEKIIEKAFKDWGEITHTNIKVIPDENIS